MLEINYFTEMILSRPLSFGFVSWIATAIFMWWDDRNSISQKDKVIVKIHSSEAVERLSKNIGEEFRLKKTACRCRNKEYYLAGTFGCFGQKKQKFRKTY